MHTVTGETDRKTKDRGLNSRLLTPRAFQSHMHLKERNVIDMTNTYRTIVNGIETNVILPFPFYDTPESIIILIVIASLVAVIECKIGIKCCNRQFECMDARTENSKHIQYLTKLTELGHLFKNQRILEMTIKPNDIDITMTNENDIVITDIDAFNWKNPRHMRFANIVIQGRINITEPYKITELYF